MKIFIGVVIGIGGTLGMIAWINARDYAKRLNKTMRMMERARSETYGKIKND